MTDADGSSGAAQGAPETDRRHPRGLFSRLWGQVSAQDGADDDSDIVLPDVENPNNTDASFEAQADGSFTSQTFTFNTGDITIATDRDTDGTYVTEFVENFTVDVRAQQFMAHEAAEICKITVR